jgi:hypothetical protein
VAIAACSHGRTDYLYHPPAPVYDVQPSVTCTDSSAHTLPPHRVSDTLSFAGTHRGDQRDAWRARHVPGGWAAGPFTSVNNRAGLMWLREPAQKLAAAAALDSLDSLHPLPAHYYQPPRPDSIVALEVRWDAAELYDWMEHIRISRPPAPIPGLNGWGLDTRRGRIVLGVERPEAAVPALAQWLRDVGAPCNLVVASQMGAVHLSSASRGGPE